MSSSLTPLIPLAQQKSCSLDKRKGGNVLDQHVHGGRWGSPKNSMCILIAPLLQTSKTAGVECSLLFSTKCARNAHRILKPGGVICSQGECLWLNEDRPKHPKKGEKNRETPCWKELITTMVQEYGVSSFVVTSYLLSQRWSPTGLLCLRGICEHSGGETQRPPQID